MDLTTISIIGAVILTLVCFCLALFPIFSSNGQLMYAKIEHEDIASRKEALMVGLNEIEFEHYTDKLSDNDFKEIKKRYEQELIKLMKAEEAPVQKEELDQKILKEVEQEIAEVIKAYRERGSKGE